MQFIFIPMIHSRDFFFRRKMLQINITNSKISSSKRKQTEKKMYFLITSLATSLQHGLVTVASRSVLDERAQNIEVVGEGLAGAPGVPDRDGHLGAGGEGEGHGHPVVVVGVDRRHVQLLRWRDDAVVRTFLN